MEPDREGGDDAQELARSHEPPEQLRFTPGVHLYEA